MCTFTWLRNDSSPRHEIGPEDADQLVLLCLLCENHYAAGHIPPTRAVFVGTYDLSQLPPDQISMRDLPNSSLYSALQ